MASFSTNSSIAQSLKSALSVAQPSPSVKSDVFPPAVRTEVKKIAGDKCWACGSEPVQVCHVVVKEDPQTELWANKGLFNFSLTSSMNAISLCPLCHVQFDSALDPGFVFLPTDLDYFINFELEDRKRRTDAAIEGITLKREVPTTEQYKKHQTENGVISRESIGGLYQPIFLKSYLLRNRLPFDIMQYLTSPLEWHGSPMASLRRAIPVLGSGRLSGLKRQTRMKLQKLRDLYFLDDEEDSEEEFANKEPGTEIPLVEPSGQGQKRKASTPQDKPKPKKQRENDDGASKYVGKYVSTTRIPWALGPNISTEEAVNRYAPLFGLVAT
ncbi:hypothetical protein V8E54_013688 [Elaphomyces granulatus]